MAARKRKAGTGGVEASILRGLERSVAYTKGDRSGVAKVARLTARDATAAPAPSVDGERVKEIRRRLKMSQALFAEALNVSAQTVRAWEQNLSVPGGSALRLLEIAERNPGALLDTVQMFRLMDAYPGRSRGKRWKREELYDR